MEIELEPRVKPLEYKVKAMSRESPSQKADHVLDTDIRSHWSTATNTKEWILLELNKPCLLSHIRIYNKSVLEWEISVGLRYKLIGVSVSGLEPEFEPVVNHLLPSIISHKQDAQDMHASSGGSNCAIYNVYCLLCSCMFISLSSDATSL